MHRSKPVKVGAKHGTTCEHPVRASAVVPNPFGKSTSCYYKYSMDIYGYNIDNWLYLYIVIYIYSWTNLNTSTSRMLTWKDVFGMKSSAEALRQPSNQKSRCPQKDGKHRGPKKHPTALLSDFAKSPLARIDSLLCHCSQWRKPISHLQFCCSLKCSLCQTAASSQKIAREPIGQGEGSGQLSSKPETSKTSEGRRTLQDHCYMF